MERKWIYLKSNLPSDALALATVLANQTAQFGVIRRSFLVPFFKGLNNVSIDFYQCSKEDNMILEIEELSNLTFYDKVFRISSMLNLSKLEIVQPYLDFAEPNTFLAKKIEEKKNVLLYLFPQVDINLYVIDQVVQIMEKEGYSFISGGSYALPCIRGTMDFRNLIPISILVAVKESISCIISTEYDMSIIGEALNIPTFILSHDLEGFKINEQYVNDAFQIANYLNLNNI